MLRNRALQIDIYLLTYLLTNLLTYMILWYLINLEISRKKHLVALNVKRDGPKMMLAMVAV